MKNKFKRIISSVLVFAFLMSFMTVFAWADNGTEDAETDTKTDEITVLYNRTYDEGWGYENGLTVSGTNGHLYSIDYEETEDFDYNYFCRVESTAAVSGYAELRYGSNTAEYGTTIFEIDLKTDDLCKVGSPILYLQTNSKTTATKYKLASISSNQLYIASRGTIDGDTSPSYSLGDLANGWVHLAFVTSVNQRICGECGTIHSMTADIANDTVICCYTETTDEAGNTVLVGETPADMEKLMTVRVYFSFSETFDVENAELAPRKAEKADLNNTYYYDMYIYDADYTTIYSYSIGLPKLASAVGHNYCIDNVKLYNGAELPTDITGYGLNIDETAAKTEQIIGSNDGGSATQYINNGLVLKVGADYCLNTGVRKPILQAEDGTPYGAPVEVDGVVYVPLQLMLDWIGYPYYLHDDGVSYDISTETGSTLITVGRTTATANGVAVELTAAPGIATDSKTGIQYIVVAMEDVEKLFDGYYVTYDDMGLIAIAEKADLFDREADLDLMLSIMKRFVYDSYSEQEYFDTVKENTNDFQHPYLLADQNYFDSLNEAYKNASDETLSSYLAEVVADAEEIYAKYVTGSAAENYNILSAEIVNIYEGLGNNGYEPTYRRNRYLVEVSDEIRLLALAYNVTLEVKYAILAYDMCVSLGEWAHWAPAYFLDCSDTTMNVALAYDWLYNVWVAEGLDIKTVEAAIYVKGLLMGYNFTVGESLNMALSSNEGVYAIYNTATDSWNVIGTSGMVIASLAILGTDYVNNDGRIYGEILGETQEITVESEYVSSALYLISSNMASLIEIGLDMYAPDGSFVESPTYWSYSIEAFMLLRWALTTAVGDDLGLINTWGMDKTFYYAFQVEYKVSDGNGYKYAFWNYHESKGDTLSSDIYFYAAEALADTTIAAIRVAQIGSKPVSIWDILAYDKAYYSAALDTSDFPLDYTLEACEAIICRSGYSEDSLYFGLMGGSNAATSGQIDSGNFIYANKGVTWIGDLGAEEGGVYSNVGTHRLGYYRATGEGNNVVLLTSSSISATMPYGQLYDAGGTITKYYANDYGMYAVLDNTEVYGGKTIYARRGVLVTNDRSTVVIQDEISFSDAQACMWVVQTSAANIELSNGDRTATLYQTVNGQTVYIRMTILEPGSASDLKFKLVDTKSAILSGTYKSNYSTGFGYDSEADREGMKRLVIQQSEATSFQCAVVIEEVSGRGSTETVEYEYDYVNSWDADTITEAFVSSGDSVDPLEVLPSRSIKNIQTYSDEASVYVINKTAFGKNIGSFFRALAIAADSVKTYEPTGQLKEGKVTATILDAYNYKYLIYISQYDAFRSEINAYVNSDKSIATQLCGYSG